MWFCLHEVVIFDRWIETISVDLVLDLCAFILLEPLSLLGFAVIAHRQILIRFIFDQSLPRLSIVRWLLGCLVIVSIIDGLRRLLGGCLSSGLLFEGIKLVRLPLFGDQVLRHVVNDVIVEAVWLSLVSLGVPHQILDVVL